MSQRGTTPFIFATLVVVAAFALDYTGRTNEAVKVIAPLLLSGWIAWLAFKQHLLTKESNERLEAKRLSATRELELVREDRETIKQILIGMSEIEESLSEYVLALGSRLAYEKSGKTNPEIREAIDKSVYTAQKDFNNAYRKNSSQITGKAHLINDAEATASLTAYLAASISFAVKHPNDYHCDQKLKNDDDYLMKERVLVISRYNESIKAFRAVLERLHA